MTTINAENLHYRELNRLINDGIGKGESHFTLEAVCGQRYIGAGLRKPVNITVNGTPGEDLATFMDGARVRVNGNAQLGTGNTMNGGTVAVDGSTGDITGHSMRGGVVLVRKSAGYRTGIHMKSFEEQSPAIVIGGDAGDYLGEYMAGGTIVVLGIDSDSRSFVGNYVGTGMHGGAIYVRGKLEDHQLGAEAGRSDIDEESRVELKELCRMYGEEFDVDVSGLEREQFTRLRPVSTRPYGRLYAY